ncbi:hypothetical protein WA026_017447 [Henosepilachna vigintioctopunctata]|uniref:tRNA-dihydrouridine(16/17) synthase [NAD(P)(+)] n=1 Tax=Henosepilachna vigintioctopunctata TaxID=420089 RepID=A0AAW1V9E6_9CUCU
MDFWKDVLGSPTKIIAPMVDASELPWRILSRRYGAQLCYTPMLHSSIFSRDPKYRKEALSTCDEDKPLIVQLCGNDPKIILQAAKLAEDHCCAIDINLGCPQAIAKRGHYGAFLQDEWPLIKEIVKTLSENLRVPVTCKIRRFEAVEKTVEFARMLEQAGCSMITLHGRTRDMKGPLTGLADWSYVTAVRKALNIPVISNGNIQCIQDLNRCLEETGAVGVMTAEGNLYNPALFLGINPPSWEPAEAYMDLVKQYPCPLSYIRGHLFKLFHHILCLEDNNVIRVRLGAANSIELFEKVIQKLKEKYLPYHEGLKKWSHTTQEGSQNLILPPWLCQSYVRLTPKDYRNEVDEANEDENYNKTCKREFQDADGNPISRKKMKKLRRINRRPEKQFTCEKPIYKCSNCVNPLGSKCNYQLCKKCCKNKCFMQNLDCIGHRILVKTRRNMAAYYAEKRKDEITETINP